MNKFSARLLKRATSWKAKSVEKLQAKQERRETRATKTLAIVLGNIFLTINFSKLGCLFNTVKNFLFPEMNLLI
jgi:hypothetical protein